MESQKLLRFLGKKISQRIKDRIRQNKIKPSKRGGGTTLVKSSRLVNSITYLTKSKSVIIGTNVKYAKIQHFGGIITPKKAKYLAIPLTKAAKVMNPRDFENTFIRNGIIFRSNGKEKPTALYVLKKQVKIPKRPFLFMDNADQKYVCEIIKKNVEESL